MAAIFKIRKEVVPRRPLRVLFLLAQYRNLFK
jgi:hypothetical protein